MDALNKTIRKGSNVDGNKSDIGREIFNVWKEAENQRFKYKTTSTTTSRITEDIRRNQRFLNSSYYSIIQKCEQIESQINDLKKDVKNTKELFKLL